MVRRRALTYKVESLCVSRASQRQLQFWPYNTFIFNFNHRALHYNGKLPRSYNNYKYKFKKHSLYYSKQDTKSKETSVQEGGQ